MQTHTQSQTHESLREVSAFPCSVPVPGPTCSPSMRKTPAARPREVLPLISFLSLQCHHTGEDHLFCCNHSESVKLRLSPWEVYLWVPAPMFPGTDTLVCRRPLDSCTLRPEAALGSAVQDKYLTGWLRDQKPKVSAPSYSPQSPSSTLDPGDVTQQLHSDILNSFHMENDAYLTVNEITDAVSSTLYLSNSQFLSVVILLIKKGKLTRCALFYSWQQTGQWTFTGWAVPHCLLVVLKSSVWNYVIFERRTNRCRQNHKHATIS